MNKFKSGMIGTSGLSVLFAVLLVVTIAPGFNSDAETTAISDNSRLGGTFTMTHFDPNGNIISQETVHNLVTNEGMECVADLLFNGTASCTGENLFSYLDVGIGGTAPTNADTALENDDVSCTRVGDATIAIDTGTTGQRTMTVSGTFSGAGCEGAAYVETGLFDTSGSGVGNMLARATFASITLSSGDSLQIDYDIVLNNT